ncbi:Oxysterol-binding protein-domain-containing protein [Phellopilus nigrolimitatus]|nr:Oxysterol-binding protein-domain-containing protein [Phellopilus nigrolimitatus]
MQQYSAQAITDSPLSLKAPVSPMASGSRMPHNAVLCEGWLLKKRRKRLQGYARRYFVLRSSGLLSYSFEPGSSVRDQISLPSAAISSSPGRKDIHVDSGTVTFHIKCLTSHDFDTWMGALRKFTVTGSEMEKAALSRSLSKGPGQSVHTGKIQHATAILDEMGRIIDELSAKFTEDDRKSVLSTDKNRSSNGKHKEKEAHSLLSLFKKTSSTSPSNSPRQSNFSEDPLSSNFSPQHSHEQLAILIAKLREEHTSLSETLSSMSYSHHHLRSPVQRTIDEETVFNPATRNTALRQSMNMSYRQSMSTITDSASIWYDASDGEEPRAEEYVVRDGPGEEESTSAMDSPKTEADGSLDQEEEEEEENDIVEDDTPEEKSDLPVNRRTRLPAGPNGEEGSLFTILKKNVGQDLSNIAFPVTFNEPLTLLQRSAEELEYHGLLDKAAATLDWVERICYVAAFAVSGYASTKHRSGRKGFTPLLGETFEETRMNFIAEKVVHKPLLIACHAEGPGWELNATSSGKTKFWGKSFEIIPTGMSHVQIGNDDFEWNKPSSFTRNLMMGTKYLEHCGEMTIKNTYTGARCVLDFKETGYWASTPNVVSGIVYSPEGNIVSYLEGKWDEQLSQKLDSNHLKVMWRISPFPRDAGAFYGFTYFGITLNEITADIEGKLPSTDSRFRPDVRALEEGNIDLAEEEKARIEQMQRERRLNGQEPKPRWFRRIEGTDDWTYAGGYWEARRGGWKTPPIKPLW